MRVTGDQLYERGRHLATRGRYVDARRVLAAGAARAEEEGDADLGARIAGTTAYVLARLGDVDAGERLCLEALEGPGLSDAAAAQLHGQLGSLALERGLLDDAAAWFDRSIEGLAGQPVRQANVRLNRSLVAMQLGRLDAAIADLEEAEQVYRGAGMVHEADLAVHNRGYVLMLGGDLVAALQTMQSVREPLDDESALWAAINEQDRAEVLREAGLVTEAERSLAAVSAAFGRHRAPRERATADYHLARSLLTHNPERAARVAALSARRFARIGSSGWAVRAEAIVLRARLAVGRIDRTGAPVRLGQRLPSQARIAEVAEALDTQGFASEAEALRLTDALARIRRNGRTAAPVDIRIGRRTPLEVGLLAYEMRAARAAADGREGEARRHSAAGLDLLDRTRLAVGSLDLQVSAAMRGSGLITTGLASALRSGSHAAVFEWSERARSLTGSFLPLRPPPDPELAAELAELRVLRSAQSDGEWLSTPRAALLSNRARQRQWSRTAAGEAHTRATLAEAIAELVEGDLVVSYVFDGVRLAALAVSHRRTKLVPLDWAAARTALSGLRADLDMAATVVDGPMASVVRRGLEDRLGALSSVLCAPLGDLLEQADRVLVAAPGVLAGVPWTMLPATRYRPLSIASSVTAWMRDRALGRSVPAAAGFAFGPRVARGDEEVTAGSAAWERSDVLRGGDATVADVTGMAARVDVLHIAAHGRHAVDNPMFSGLELVDGTLFGYDIDLIERVPDTVVLSACEVGRSSVRWGEEALGMTRVWLHAGARSVIAAPVVVADDNACELLGAMHEGLAAGVGPSEALAAASERTGIVAPFQVHGAGF